jgi:hypothetical protein
MTEHLLNRDLEQSIKRQACDLYKKDNLQPDEVIVGDDGSITIDRRARYPWAKPSTGLLRWAPPGAMPGPAHTPDPGTRRTPAQAGGSIPDAWGPVVGQAADFEPESDGHLLDWMAGQVTGMAAYAEALIEAYETGVSTVGIDPKGLAALHDVADAAAHAAETMSGARTKFSDHYELPREFAANGGVMTHDGRWVTGEGG